MATDEGLAIFDATVSGAAANSYLTRAEADEQIEAYDGADAWSELGQEAKDRLLLKAARLIDRYRKDAGGWGVPKEQTQRLAFPRICDVNGIPEEVKSAALEIISKELTSNLDEIKRPQAEGVTSISVLGATMSLTADESLLPVEARAELEILARSYVPIAVKNPKPPCAPFFSES